MKNIFYAQNDEHLLVHKLHFQQWDVNKYLYISTGLALFTCYLIPSITFQCEMNLYSTKCSPFTTTQTDTIVGHCW